MVLVVSRVCFPHARGDGPITRSSFNEAQRFSPTPVGMVRWDMPSADTLERFPHARGDGPAWERIATTPAKFSPRPWGWSGRLAHGLRNGVVFPHARGDGPRWDMRSGAPIWFSPRPWGWSVFQRGFLVGGRRRVFPTPVGMVRSSPNTWACPTSFPHARGDGPLPMSWSAVWFGFSPRPWGWSARRTADGALRPVFPTPVGMVRGFVAGDHSSPGFPHARGDGPRAVGIDGSEGKFSPRPWGWSAR